jgi:integrase
MVGTCDLWVNAGRPLCRGHEDRWMKAGRPDLVEFTTACEQPGPGPGERIDLRGLPPQLRLEVQYVLQSRRDEGKARIVPGKAHRAINLLTRHEITSLLDGSDDFWRGFCPASQPGERGRTAFLLDAHRRIEDLAYGRGWHIEYPRPVWRLRNLGVDLRQPSPARISFAQIPQMWLTDLAKRWARWRLSIEHSAPYVNSGVSAVVRFARFISAAGADTLAGVDRALIERYLADLHTEFGGRRGHRHHIGALAGFLNAIRQHHWDDALPTTAMIFADDYPKGGELLPRALAEHIMAQVEDPANLSRWDNPAYRLITLILIRCGVRISSAVQLDFDCVVTDADSAPYLRYHNTKMKREALVPIDEELWQEIRDQQQRVLRRWPTGTPVLFPRPINNLDGTLPIGTSTYRDALYRWLQLCDVRDEHGRPALLTPHQWRHSLGTRLINRDVPQHVVQKILDHDSPEMTAHYARLSDTTVRQHWERARKVNARGETVTLDPDGPLAEAAWAKQRLSRATQALPNGYCGLPVARSCPHANSCLTCPMFLTTAEFLPQHRQQHQQTLQIISAAEARGQARMVEMNQQVADNLERVITGLEAEGPQQVADAS